MYRNPAFFLIVVICISADSIHAQWTQVSDGLYGGGVSCMIEKDNLIFAGTRGAGVFVSSNGGDSWAAASNGLPRAAEVTGLTRIGNSIFVGLFSGGVYRSNDSGANWTRMHDASSPLFQVYTLYSMGSNLFVGSTQGLFLSSDNGATWVTRSTGIPSGGHVNVFKHSGSRIFAGLSFKGLYSSDDLGLTWIAATTVPSNANVGALEVDGTNVFAGVTNDGLYFSSNNGETWSLLGGLTQNSITTLSMIDNTLYAGTYFNGMYKSANNGSTWNLVVLDRQSSINFVSKIGTELFLGTSVGIYRSVSGGTTWQPINNQLRAIQISSIAVSGSKLIAGSNYGVGLFLSANGGDSWNSVFSPPSTNNYSKSCVLAQNDTLIGALQGFIKLSTNGGNTWIDYHRSNAYTFGLLINGGSVFRGDGTGLFVYEKGATNWTSVANGINTDQWISGLAKVGNVMFAGTVLGQGVLRSDDFGKTWIEKNNGLASGIAINSVYSSSKRVFAPTNSGLFYSSNLGETWTKHPSLSNGAIFFLGGIGFMAAYDAVLYSLDEGETWVDSNNQFPGHLAALSVGCNGNTVFVGTSSGVWSAPLSNFNPVITDFSPSGGSVGTVITIKGKNFTTPEFITVRLNGIIAPIVASSPTEITINVPDGASTGKITVEINGKTAQSVANFCVAPPIPTISAVFSDLAGPVLKSSSLIGNQWYLNGVKIQGAVGQTLSVTEPGLYTVTTSGSGCESEQSQAQPVIITELMNRQEQDRITVFPSPVDQAFTISLKGYASDQTLTFSIYNSLGCHQMDLIAPEGRVEADASHLTPGIYLIKASTGGRLHILKFVKE